MMINPALISAAASPMSSKMEPIRTSLNSFAAGLVSVTRLDRQVHFPARLFHLALLRHHVQEIDLRIHVLGKLQGVVNGAFGHLGEVGGHQDLLLRVAHVRFVAG